MDNVFEGNVQKWNIDLKLIKATYLQQNLFNQYYDFDGKALYYIIKQDKGFLYELVQGTAEQTKFEMALDHRTLNLLWDIKDIEVEIRKIFDLSVEKDNYYGLGEHFCNVFFNNLTPEQQVKAEKFLLNYLQDGFSDTRKVNVIVDIARHTQKHLFETVLLDYISLNQDKEAFGEIWWRGNGGTYTGEVNMGDIEASEWKNIYSIVQKSNIGVKLIPIKNYINQQAEYALKSGDWERKRKFLRNEY
jgi:hypothetical protein